MEFSFDSVPALERCACTIVNTDTNNMTWANKQFLEWTHTHIPVYPVWYTPSYDLFVFVYLLHELHCRCCICSLQNPNRWVIFPPLQMCSFSHGSWPEAPVNGEHTRERLQPKHTLEKGNHKHTLSSLSSFSAKYFLHRSL